MGTYDQIKSFCNNNVDEETLPSMIKFEMSGVCNLNCVFCSHSLNKDRNRLVNEDDLNLFTKRFDEYQSKYNSIKEIGLFNIGESALNPLLPNAYKRFKEKGLRTFLTTNAVSIDNVIKSLEWIDSIKVSWNYFDEYDFNLKTNTKGLYEKVRDNINNLYLECLEHNKRLSISSIVSRKDEEFLYANSLRGLNYHEHFFIPLQRQIDVTDGEGGIRGTVDNTSNETICWSIFKGIYVDCNLNVRTCDYGYKEEHILGNLKVNTLEECLFNDKTKSIKEQMLKGIIPDICKRCRNIKE